MKNNLLCALVLVLSGVSLLPSCQASALDVMDRETIRVGTEATYPPFEYRNEKNEIVGYEIEIATAICEHLGKKVEIVDMAFDGLVAALLTGKIDMVAAGMINTEERRKKVDFSDVYFEIEDVVVVRADDDSISSLEDLAGRIATVQMGTTQDVFITETGLPSEIKRFQKNDDALMEVKFGRADFCVLNLTVGNSFLRNNKAFSDSLKVAFRNKVGKEGEGIAVALPKGDEAFLSAVNEAIDTLKGSGKFDELKQKYQID